MNELPLAGGLTAKTNQLCVGLEDGVADIYATSRKMACRPSAN